MRFRFFALTLILLVTLTALPILAQDSTTNTIELNGISFSFDSSMGVNVNILQYPGDAPDLQQPGGPEPRFTQFGLYTQQPSPEGFFSAPVSLRVYQLADIAAYEGSQAQVTALQDLLTNRPDLSSYMIIGENVNANALPYLPVVAAGQVSRARAQYIDTPVLSGISYVVAYRQDASPFVNTDFLYTIQGISTDGVYYVAAVMQVVAPDIPAGIPADFDYEAFIPGLTDYLNETIATLNAATPEAFSPPLTALDTLAQTVTMPPAGGTPPVVETAVPTPSDPTLGGLAGMTWTLVSHGPADAPTPVLENAPITAIFSEQGVGGSGGCNTYGGSFTYNAGTITFGNIISTLIACDEPIMTQETAYFAALGSASSYTISGSTLQIVYDGGVLTYTGQAATPVVETPVPGATASDPTLGGLANMVWTLVSYGPADAPIPALEGAPVTAVFTQEGVSGNAGCNSYNGPFVYNQNTITFGALVSTLMACTAQEVNTQETAYLAALSSATTFTITDSTLQIVYDGGVLTFTGMPAA